MSKKIASLVLALVAPLALSGCDSEQLRREASSMASQAAQRVEDAASQAAKAPGQVLDDTRVALAQQKLQTLPVKGRAPKTGYSRDVFGPAWADVDRNGCDTRNDILARDLTQVAFKAGTHDCVVTSGVLADPYTGTTIQFTRGQNTSAAVQIDHVVPLSDAWQKGAQNWSSKPDSDNLTRFQRFANDPANLQATDGPTNGAKGDGDAATWLPSNRGYWCEYGVRIVEVKSKYELWVTAAEKDSLNRLLNTCQKG